MKIEIKQVTEQLTGALRLARNLKAAVLVDEAENIAGWCVVRQEEDGGIYPVSNRYDNLKQLLDADLTQYQEYDFEGIKPRSDEELMLEYEKIRMSSVRAIVEAYSVDQLEFMRFLDNRTQIVLKNIICGQELERNMGRTNKTNEDHE